MRDLFRYIILLFAALCVSMTAGAKDQFVVVIDAGHGGKDSGCSGNESKEKNIVLKVAKLLKAQIEKEYPKDVKVVLTRSSDTFVDLQKRADIANNAHGDLFISIHINSLDKKNKKRKTMSGASVYTCGLHKSQNNLQVAMRENSVMELEPDYTTRYKGFDPNSSESYIMFELSQSAHQQQSIDFAKMAQKELVATAGRADQSVRQAGFWVLWATAMPAVLVELDYICNPVQERFLNSEAGQKKCAKALFNAFSQYYKHVTTNH